MEFEMFIEEIKAKYPVLSREEEKQLLEKKDSREALDKLKYSNASLVLKFVYNYRAKYESLNLDILELFEAGMDGFEEGIKKYNSSFDNRVTTYARWYAINGIEKYIEGIIKYRKTFCSLDEKIGDDEESLSLEDFISDLRYDVEEYEDRKELNKIWRYVFRNVLTEQEGCVLMMSCGINTRNCEKMNYSQIARELGLSRQRIDQIRVNYTKKIRSYFAKQNTGFVY